MPHEEKEEEIFSFFRTVKDKVNWHLVEVCIQLYVIPNNRGKNVEIRFGLQ